MEITSVRKYGNGLYGITVKVNEMIFSRFSIGTKLIWWKDKRDYLQEPKLSEIEGIFQANFNKYSFKELLELSFDAK